MSAAPIIGLVERLKIVDICVKQQRNLLEKLGIAADPVIRDGTGHAMAELLTWVANDLMTDQTINAQSLLTQAVNNRAVGLGPGASRVQRLVIGTAPRPQDEVEPHPAHAGFGNKRGLTHLLGNFAGLRINGCIGVNANLVATATGHLRQRDVRRKMRGKTIRSGYLSTGHAWVGFVLNQSLAGAGALKDHVK